MKYYTWKLKWEVNPDTGQEEGTDPTSIVNTDSVRISPIFPAGDLVADHDTLVYAILEKGTIDPSALTDWAVTEVTAEEVLAAAQAIDAGATILDGYIRFTPREVAP